MIPTAFVALVLVRSRKRVARDGPPAAYTRALRLLARRGLVRAGATPARAFAAHVRERVPARAAAAFDALTETYLAERFGGRAPVDSRSWLRDLASALAAPR